MTVTDMVKADISTILLGKDFDFTWFSPSCWHLELHVLSASPFLHSGVLYQGEPFKAHVYVKLWRKKGSK